MSPLGVAQWKIEIPYFRGPLPQTVVSRMSPLGVAHWKSKQVPKIKCPPPRLEAKKIHLLRKWFFLASGQGGGQTNIYIFEKKKPPTLVISRQSNLGFGCWKPRKQIDSLTKRFIIQSAFSHQIKRADVESQHRTKASNVSTHSQERPLFPPSPT